jgi:hypothetical protein
MYLWDLTTTLGWASGSGCGSSGRSQPGTWRQLLERPGLAEQVALAPGMLWPAPLGALPCETSLAVAQLSGGPAFHLLCMCAEAGSEEEYVQAMRLLP